MSTLWDKLGKYTNILSLNIIWKAFSLLYSKVLTNFYCRLLNCTQLQTKQVILFANSIWKGYWMAFHTVTWIMPHMLMSCWHNMPNSYLTNGITLWNAFSWFIADQWPWTHGNRRLPLNFQTKTASMCVFW